MSFQARKMKIILKLFVIVISFLEPTQVNCNILTPLIKTGNAKQARRDCTVNSTYFNGIQSCAGFITVNEKYNSNLYFWFFPKYKMENTPWIIWLQGGPGATSLMGLFDLIGPIKIVNGKVALRDVTWAEDYSLLFLDNPVGAGFSFTDDDRGYTDNEEDVGSQMYEFLLQFLEMFPELLNAPLFIAGESYAGKYVPALGIQVHRQKKIHPINLRGIMIGNGLIDPRTMMHYSTLCRVLGIVGEDKIKQIEIMEENIVRLIGRREMVDAANLFNATIEFIKEESGISVYNIEKDPNNSAPDFEGFVTKPSVREWIHAGNASFDFDNQIVYEKMLPDIMNTTKPWLEELLEYYGVMCYSGQLDVILAYSLSKHTYAALQWSARDKYDAALRTQIRRTMNGSVIGYVKKGGNFAEVLIRSAGHATMVEQPEATKFIVNNFVDEFK